MYDPQPISDRPVGLGFPHRAGRFRPGGSLISISSPDCRSCTCMEGFLKRRWGAIFPVCGEIVGFPRGATLAARASPPHWPRTAEGGRLGQWDWGSENAEMKVICLLYCTYLSIFDLSYTYAVHCLYIYQVCIDLSVCGGQGTYCKYRPSRSHMPITKIR